MATIILFAPLVGALICGFGWRLLGEKAGQVITTALGVAASGTGAGAGAVAINLSTWSDAAAFDPAGTKGQDAKGTGETLDYIGGKAKSYGFTTRASVESASIKAANITIDAANKSTFAAVLLLVGASGTGAGAGGLVFNLMDSLSTAYLNVTGALQASGAVAGQTVGHFHLHVLPRHAGDGVDLAWPRKEPGPAALADYAERLRAALAREEAQP